MRTDDVAYAAGFFDGEGHIRIQRHSARGSYMLSVSAVQATLTPLDFLSELFGGVVKKRTTKYKGADKAMYEWRLSSAAAERALAEMLPFIRAKKDEALVALEFRKTFRPQFGDRSRLGDDVVAGRMAMMYRLQEMRKEKRTASLVAYA